MINNTKNLIEFLMKTYIKNVDVAVDMTAGNGHDCKNILELTGAKKLYAFDIQEEAKASSLALLEKSGLDLSGFSFILDSHENIGLYVKEKVDLAIYNLGYLPKSDHRVTTQYQKVLRSLDSLLEILNDNAVVLFTFYPGHDEGQKEILFIPEYLEKLDQKSYSILKFEFINQKNKPPFSIMLQKRKA